MEKKPIELSRRKMLAGLGTVGVAAGAAGFGTWSAFSDQAQVDTTFTAGELDGMISYEASYNGDTINSSDGSIQAHPQEEVPVALSLEDVKPGDFGSLVFGIDVETNPAWVFSCIDYENNDDNGINHPESFADDDASDGVTNEDEGAGLGELAENMLMIPFYDTNVNSSFFDSDGPPENQNLGSYGSGTSTDFWDNATGSLVPKTVDNIADTQLAQGTEDWVDGTEDSPVETYVGCVLLNGAQTNDTNEQGFAPLDPGNTIMFGYDWHLPYTVGNEAQTDTLDILFGFDFQQSRHNSTPDQPNVFNPGDNASSDPGEGDNVTGNGT